MMIFVSLGTGRKIYFRCVSCNLVVRIQVSQASKIVENHKMYQKTFSSWFEHWVKEVSVWLLPSVIASFLMESLERHQKYRCEVLKLEGLLYLQVLLLLNRRNL